MSSCQICGKETDSLTKIKLEGTRMNVCSDCEDLGTKVDSSSKSSRRRSKKKKSSGLSNKRDKKVLDQDYGEKIRSARNEKNLTQKDLAQRLNEKESFVRKVENEEMKPPKSTAKKLENALEIEIYVEDVVTDPKYTKEDQGSGGQTIGDVVDID